MLSWRSLISREKSRRGVKGMMGDVLLVVMVMRVMMKGS
jgi:hypothetical protein